MNPLALNPRLRKEVRPLVYPLFAAIALELYRRSMFGLHSPARTVFVYEWFDVALVYIFGLAVAFFAARAFAVEYQEKTLSLWLCQPISRTALLRDKFVALAIPTGVLAVVVLECCLPGLGNPGVWLALGLGLLSAIASAVSAPLLASVAKTAIGTFALILCAQYVAVMGFLLIGAAISAHYPLPDGLRYALSAVAYLGFIAFFAGFGWIRTLTLESIEGRVVGTGGTEAAVGFLRVQRQGALRNLARKELNLHRGSILVAGVFIAVVGLMGVTNHFAAPSVRSIVDMLSIIPFAVYLPVMTLLSGATAFADELSLGTHAWGLTQPVSARSQFLIKFGVSFFVFCLLGLAIPALVVLAYERFFPGHDFIHYADFRPKNGNPTGIARNFSVEIPVAGFFLCFWISSVVPNLVRAGLIALAVFVGWIAIVVLAFVRGFGLDWGTVFPLRWDTTRVGPMVRLAYWYEQQPDYVRRAVLVALLTSYFVLLVWLAAANWRRATFPRRQAATQFLGTCVYLLCFALVWVELETSEVRVERAENEFVSAVTFSIGNAIRRITPDSLDETTERIFTWQQIESSGELNPAVRQMYAGSTHEVRLKTKFLKRGGYYQYITIDPGLRYPDPFTKVMQRTWVWRPPEKHPKAR